MSTLGTFQQVLDENGLSILDSAGFPHGLLSCHVESTTIIQEGNPSVILATPVQEDLQWILPVPTREAPISMSSLQVSLEVPMLVNKEDWSAARVVIKGITTIGPEITQKLTLPLSVEILSLKTPSNSMPDGGLLLNYGDVIQNRSFQNMDYILNYLSFFSLDSFFTLLPLISFSQ
jgi:hypothetical protein